MSSVDNVALSFGVDEDEEQVMRRVNTWMKENAYGQQFKSPADYGDNKRLETPLYIGAFNYMPEVDFPEFLGSIQWRSPEDVQYITKRQYDDRFEVL